MARVTAWITVDRRGVRAPHVQADALALPFSGLSFDTVICLEVLEYVVRPLDALREMHRVLRPRGRIVLSTPFLHRWDGPDDLWRFTPHGLRRLLGESGFVVEDERAQGAALATAANVLAHLVRTIFARRYAAPARAIGALVAELLFRLDAGSARSHPDLRSFSTGYLIVARRV